MTIKLGELLDLRGYPPCPYLLKVLMGAASAKSVCKILMSKNLEVKILSAKELGPALCRLV